MEQAQVKRLFELRIADPRFRDLRHVRRETLLDVGVDLDRDGVEALFSDPVASAEDALCQYHKWRRDHPAVRGKARQRPGNEHYWRWRRRQIGRVMTQTSAWFWRDLTHSPFAIELSSGCSIGCDYCAFSAGRLRAVAGFTADNERLFRTVLEVLGEFIGQELESCSLYGATEPMDNPDYEKYLQAIHEQFGATPQTTTAGWHRDVERTRRLLQHSRSHNGHGDRLTINSAEQLRLCMKEFSAEELENTELVVQSAGLRRAASGRGSTDANAVTGTIACVTGFLLNLVDRSARMVSPCPDLKRWPYGYAVYKEGHFADANELNDFLEQCVDEVMRPSELDDETILQLRDDFEVDLGRSDRVVLRTECSELTFGEESACAVLKSVDGQRTAGQIVDGLMDEHGAAQIYYDLGRMYSGGLFERLP